MIGAHLAGIQHTYKHVNKTSAKCLVCGEYSECQIVKYEVSVHVFFRKIKILDGQFWFDWKKCNHRAVLYDKQDISRYKQEQVETGMLSVPYYQNMKLRMMPMPKRSRLEFALGLVIALTLGLILAALLIILQKNLVSILCPDQGLFVSCQRAPLTCIL